MLFEVPVGDIKHKELCYNICYRLNVRVPPKIHVQILTPKVMLLGVGAFGRGVGHEGSALMNGISILIKETPESSLAFSAI